MVEGEIIVNYRVIDMSHESLNIIVGKELYYYVVSLYTLTS